MCTNVSTHDLGLGHSFLNTLFSIDATSSFLVTQMFLIVLLVNGSGQNISLKEKAPQKWRE